MFALFLLSRSSCVSEYLHFVCLSCSVWLILGCPFYLFIYLLFVSLLIPVLWVSCIGLLFRRFIRVTSFTNVVPYQNYGFFVLVCFIQEFGLLYQSIHKRLIGNSSIRDGKKYVMCLNFLPPT